ncbi:glycosyltransferase [Myroides marinus]|uniref:glycosyltransferase family 2 protein n=1 Tax=Myroides marinus TaxID=703342 RepID=UPI002576B4A5|nr:glycosyltransferase family 2 protein [Myroides marinus]MDM1391402.1 glycosyltransferase [Myroides marinus]
MKLSIIIPAYNVQDYIVECVNVLFNQGLESEDFEVIIINDGSTDSTLKECLFLEQKYKNVQVRSQENKGQSVARNVGISIASGEYVFFMDSDDLILQGTLGSFIQYIYKKGLDFLGFGFSESLDRSLALSSFSNNFNIIFEGSGEQLIEDYNYYNGPCWFIFKKSLVLDLKFISGIYCEDALFTPRLILNMERCEVISEAVYIYFMNDKSTLREKTYEKNKKLFLDMFFVASDFDNIYKEFKLSQRAYSSLRVRQESFVFYGVIRFFRLHEDITMLFNEIRKFSFENYKLYPLKEFRGSGIVEKVLLGCINRSFLLKGLNNVNRFLKVIK